MIRETLPPTLEDEGNTYEKIRHRITRLLKSPRAQEVNKNVRKLIVYNLDKNDYLKFYMNVIYKPIQSI